MVEPLNLIKCSFTMKNITAEMKSEIQKHGIERVKVFGDISSSDCVAIICSTEEQSQAINTLIMEMYYKPYLPTEPLYFNSNEIMTTKRGAQVGLCLPNEVYSHLFDDFVKLDKADKFMYADVEKFINTAQSLVTEFKKDSFKKIEFN